MVNKFDKVCAVVAIPLGGVLMVLGALGLFWGCKADFSLPPFIGFLPFLAGWAMCVTVIKYWMASNTASDSND